MKVKIFVIMLLLALVNKFHLVAMEKEGSITKLSQETIRYIASYLKTQHDIISLASTCKYLHATATQENMIISILAKRSEYKNAYNPQKGCWELESFAQKQIANNSIFSKISITTQKYIYEHTPTLISLFLPIKISDELIFKESIKQFLDEVYLCIKHIIARKGNNPIQLMLSDNDLSLDMTAFAEFLTKCSDESIAQHIASLDLSKTQLSYLPQQLKGLTHLESIHIENNNLELKDLELLITSFPKLEYVNCYNTGIDIRDIYHLLAQTPTKVKIINAINERLFHDSKTNYFLIPFDKRKSVEKKVKVYYKWNP